MSSRSTVSGNVRPSDGNIIHPDTDSHDLSETAAAAANAIVYLLASFNTRICVMENKLKKPEGYNDTAKRASCLSRI